MQEAINIVIEIAAQVFEIAGVLTMIFGSVIALVRYAVLKRSYENLRQNIGKAILLGLEFLVAADIIATVGIDPSMEQVLVLGLIVLIRTFLSFSLDIELNGKVPWKQEKDKS